MKVKKLIILIITMIKKIFSNRREKNYNMNDIYNIKNYVLGYKKLTDKEKIKYDYNNDGEVDLFDAVLIMNNENIKDTNSNLEKK